MHVQKKSRLIPAESCQILPMLFAQIKAKVAEEEKKAENYKESRVCTRGRLDPFGKCDVARQLSFYMSLLEEGEKLAKKVAESREVLQASWRGQRHEILPFSVRGPPMFSSADGPQLPLHHR